jgi:hypothetical protein
MVARVRFAYPGYNGSLRSFAIWPRCGALFIIHAGELSGRAWALLTRAFGEKK